MNTRKITANKMKRELTFGVTRNGLLIAAFQHVNDAEIYASEQNKQFYTVIFEVEIIL